MALQDGAGVRRSVDIALKMVMESPFQWKLRSYVAFKSCEQNFDSCSPQVSDHITDYEMDRAAVRITCIAASESMSSKRMTDN